jgi:hypothetical protein
MANKIHDKSAESRVALENQIAGASSTKTYQIRALGYCFEMTAHNLNAKQLESLHRFCDQEGISPTGELPCLEGVIEDYDMYNTNMWQTGTVPVVGSSRYGCYDNENKEIFLIEDITPYSLENGQNFEVFTADGDVLLACEEFKGTTAVWTLVSTKAPQPNLFRFNLGKVLYPDSDIAYFVENLFYEGQELERDYDEEFLVGKASYSKSY